MEGYQSFVQVFYDSVNRYGANLKLKDVIFSGYLIQSRKAEDLLRYDKTQDIVFSPETISCIEVGVHL